MSEITPETSPHPSPIFFGPHGLRAGWSLAIALFTFLLSLWLMKTLLSATHLVSPRAIEHTPGPLAVLLTELAAFLAVEFTTSCMSKIEGRPVSVYGFGGAHKLSRLLRGAILGLLAISLLILILLKANLLVIDRRLLAGSAIFRYALLWIPAFLLIGFFEEYLFRGYLQYTLARGLSGIAHSLPGQPDPQTTGFWISAVLVSFGFGAIHGSNPGESPAGLVCAGLASLLFCFSLWRTGSLWWAVGLHAAWDYGQSFLYGVADSGTFFQHRLFETHPIGSPLLSGGTTGPEGSIFCLIPLSLLAIAIHFTQPKNASSYASRMPSTPSRSTGEPSDQLI